MIEIQNISKTYRVHKRQAGLGNAVKSLFSREYETVNALNSISFSVGDGEIIGFIGPNGAGKSTTIKIMCGILTPDSGSCIVNGKIPWEDRSAYVKDIGVVFGQRSQLWWDVPIIDSFELLKDMYGIDHKKYKDNLEELTSLLDLTEILKTPTRNLSLGQRMRCEVAASLLHTPQVLFLDEPTIGLDAVSKMAVRTFLKKVNKERGTTVIITTHDMQDIEALTERVLLIGHGKILLDGQLDELKKRCSTEKKIRIRFDGDPPVLCVGMKCLESKPGQMIIAVDQSVFSVPTAIAYLASHTGLNDVSVSDISAEEMVAVLYKEYGI